MDLDSAVHAHSEWKVKFRQAIAGKQQMDATSIAADDCCTLGKWLYAEGKKQYGGLKSHADCVAKHANFHREAGRVARAINAGNYTDAEALLAGGTAYAAASSAVGGAIMGLKKEAKL